MVEPKSRPTSLRPISLRADPGPFVELPPSVSSGGNYQPVSFWQETVAVEPCEKLSADTTCDVVILGGGYTGLSAAYELKRAQPSLDVVVLERDVVGHGASGRNGGFLMPLLGWNLAKTVRSLGRERAAQGYRVMYDAIAHTRAVIERENIDCDLEDSGYLLLATSRQRLKHVREEAELGKQLGFGYEYFEGTALQEHVDSDGFLGGCFDPDCSILNPAKLARGLKVAVERLGVRVYEQTSADSLEDGESIRIGTDHGKLTARAAVVAVNGYGSALGFMKNQVIPVHTYIVLTEPLSDAQLAAIGWHKRTSLETSRNFIHYFRLTADNRILFGGEDAKLFFKGRLRDADEDCFQRLEVRLRSFFPALGETKVTHRWGGVVGVTLDMFPTFGASGRQGNVFYGCGYSGHGVSLANYAGKIIAPAVLKRLGLAATEVAPPLRFGREPWRLPPEPLTFVGMQAYRLALHAADRWTSP